MSGMDTLLISMLDVEAMRRLLIPGVCMRLLLDASATLLIGGGTSLGAPISKNVSVKPTNLKEVGNKERNTEKSGGFVEISL